MTTYYRDPDVQVTSESISVRGQTYPLAELARVWHQRGARSWRAVAGRGALGVAMLIPLGLAAIGVAVATTLNASPTTTLTLVGAALLVGLAVGPVADFILEHMDRSY